MAVDSGLNRQISLPERLEQQDDLQLMVRRIFNYLNLLNDALVSNHDEVAGRINEFLTFQEWQEKTHDQITGDQNNYDLGDFGIVHRFTLDAPHTITGFVAPLVARFVIVLNVGSPNLSIANQSASSDAPNRVITRGGGSITIQGAEAIGLWYDLTDQRWRHLTS